MVSQPGSGPTRPKSPCYNNTLRQPPLRKSVKWTQSDKTQSDSPVNHSRECATIEQCTTLTTSTDMFQHSTTPVIMAVSTRPWFITKHQAPNTHYIVITKFTITNIKERLHLHHEVEPGRKMLP